MLAISSVIISFVSLLLMQSVSLQFPRKVIHLWNPTVSTDWYPL